jgi:TM2 domain-containing membrane protein YozV
MPDFTAMEQATLIKDFTDQQKMLFVSQFESEKKDPGTVLILSVLFGAFGVDRFMLGDTGMGLVKLFTFGGCGIITIIDWFTTKGRANDYNRARAHEIAQSIRLTS